MSTKEGFAQGGRDVEGGAAQRYDLTFLPAALEPMNMTFLGKGDESTDRIAIPEEAVAVVAEFVAGTGGTGAGLAYQILQAGFSLNIPRLFAALFLITLTGIALFAVMVALSRLTLSHWHESELA